MEIRVEVFERICRVCLSESNSMRSLLSKMDGEERNLYDVLAFTANIHITFEDTLPKQVCNECESIMCKADSFKRRCLESDTILNNVYQNTNIAMNTSIIPEKCQIKHETNDFKHNLRQYDPYQPSNSSNNYFQDSFDKKNVLIHEFTPCTTLASISNKFTDTKVPDDAQRTVKEELVNNIDEENHFSDHFNDEIHVGSVAIELEHTVKTESKSYTCYCAVRFTSKDKYKTHIKTCSKYKKLVKELGNEEIVEIIPIKNRLRCTHCDSEFSSTNAWRSHQRKHTKPQKLTELFQCSLCLRKFKNKVSLANHIQKHEETANIKYTCEICKREFKYKAYLDNHILSAHSRHDGFTCEICAKGFSSRESLEIHKDSHKNEKKHQCSVCSKGFFMLCTLKEHMRTHTGEKPFLCSQCGRGFSQKTNLAQHMRRHQGLKPFKCEICEKRFVSKGELDAHARKHTGAHPFVCDDCGNGFTTSSALVKHRRTHTGERPYLCDLCPMRFAASGTLKNHRRTHTGERPFQCSYCEKAFVQRNDLISHIRCHTGERPYICTVCGQSFRKASGLKTHVKMHGKDVANVSVMGVNVILGGMQCTEQ